MFEILRDKQKKPFISLLCVVVVAILLWFALSNADVLRDALSKVVGILTPFIGGGVVAYLLDPICDRLYDFFLKQFGKTKLAPKRGKGLANGLSILLSLLLLLGIVVLLIGLIVSQLVPSVTALANAIPGYATDIYNFILPLIEGTEVETWLAELDVMGTLKTWITDTLLPNAEGIVSTITTSVGSVIGVISNLVIGFIVSFYCLSYRAKFALQGKKVIFALFPFKWAEEILERLRFADKAFSGFISGQLLDSLIIGIITFFGCMLLQIPYYPLIAVIVGMTNIIPFFGPYIGGIPSAFLILMEDPLKCVYFVIFILVLQQIDGNIISPRILSTTVGVSGFWVLFSILFFGGLFGVVGMLIGTPLFAIIYSIVRDWVDVRLKKKALPTQAWNYDDLDAFEDTHRPDKETEE